MYNENRLKHDANINQKEKNDGKVTQGFTDVGRNFRL